MTERTNVNRAVTPDEIAVLRTALERAPASPSLSSLGDDLAGLRVIERCPCGCDSVDFAEPDFDRPAKPIADAIGTTRTGGMVGVIVWGTEEAVTGLEVYDLGTEDGDVRLPVPSSIRPFHERPG
jgi:hypothetical protein